MPCRDYRTEAEEREERERQQRTLADLREQAAKKEALEVDYEALVARYDDVSVDLQERDAMLCATINAFAKVIDERNLKVSILCVLKAAEEQGKCPGIVEWYREHQEQDEERLKRAADSFMSQFSNDEKKILTRLIASS